MAPKKTAVMVVVLAVAALCLVIAQPAWADSVTQPSVPQFTVKLVVSSYDTQATTSVDPYTGQTTINPSQHITQKNIQIMILNQPVTNKNYTLYYDVHAKGHFENEWKESSWTYTSSGTLVPQTNTEYTEILFPASSYSDNAQMDFQVRALLGGYTQMPIPGGPHLMGPSTFTTFGILADGEGNWSETQTLSFNPNPIATVQPTFTASPAAENSTVTMAAPAGSLGSWAGTPVSLGLFILVVAVLVVVILSMAVLFYRKTHPQQNIQ